MLDHTILITGAGGKTGRTLVRSLSKVGSVAAFVHREEHVSLLKSLGAEKIIVGDLRDGAAIRSAMQDVRAVYHICPNMVSDEVEIGELVVREAQKEGVEHFIYHSVLHPQTEKMHHHWQKLRVEEMILESGLAFTIFQPAPYMQNMLTVWKSIVEGGVLQVPYSVLSKFSFIDLEDVAGAAKSVLMEHGYKNAVLELAGTYPMSHVELAEIVGRVLKRSVQAEKVEIREWKLRAGGMSEYAVDNLIKMFEYYDRYGLPGNPSVLHWLLKRKPTSLEEFVERSAADYVI